MGEGLEQVNLGVGERPGLAASYHDHSDGCALPQHWNKEAASPAHRPGKTLLLVLRIALDIGNMDDGASEDRSARPHCSARACREQPTGRLEGFGSEVVLRDGMDQLTIEPVEIAEESAAQPQGTPDDRVEHGLD